MSNRIAPYTPQPEPERETSGKTAQVPQKLAPLTIRTIDEILRMEHDDEDFLLENGYLMRGDRTAICGMGGAGKSRLVMQWAMCSITGHSFLEWETRGRDTRWLFLQSENSTRRLQSELRKMLTAYTESERNKIATQIFFHTLEADDDGFLALNDASNRDRISKAIEATKADVVVCDPLRDFATDDLNSDEGMRETLSWLTRIVRKGNAKRTPLVIHHAGTGRAGIAKASGYDRSSFGRNSKVLFGWARAQINVAPVNPDDNKVLIVASGKCSNAVEFERFAIRLNTDTMSYEVAHDLNLDEWEKRVNEDGKGRGRQKEPEDLLSLVTELEKVPKAELAMRAQNAGIAEKRFRVLLDILTDRRDLHEHKQKRAGARARILISRLAPTADEQPSG